MQSPIEDGISRRMYSINTYTNIHTVQISLNVSSEYDNGEKVAKLLTDQLDRLCDDQKLDRVRATVCIQMKLTREDGSNFYSSMDECLGEIEYFSPVPSSYAPTLSSHDLAREIIYNQSRDIVQNDVAFRFNNYLSHRPYFQTLIRMDIHAFPIPNEGGCTPKRTTSFDLKYNGGNDCMRLKSFKSSNNNCLLSIINNRMSIKKVGRASASFFLKIRRGAGIDANTLITIQQIPAVVASYKEMGYSFGIIVYNHRGDVIFSHAEAEIIIDVLLTDVASILTPAQKTKDMNTELLGHWFWIESFSHEKCESCGRVFRFKHECNTEMERYYQTKILGKNVLKVPQLSKDKRHAEKVDLQSFVYFDFESFQHCEGVEHEVYAVGVYDAKFEKYIHWWGKNALNDFMDYVLQLEDRIISAFNGSQWDFYFVLRQLIARGYRFKQDALCISNGRILKLCFGNNIQVWDLLQVCVLFLLLFLLYSFLIYIHNI